MNHREVVVLSGVRTPIADFGGALKSLSPTQLAASVITEAVQRSGANPGDIGHCVMGNVIHSDRRDMYLSRIALLKAGLPVEIPALTVNRLCGSGMQAIVSATQMLLLGDCNITIAGGAESMSRVPYWLPTARFGSKMGDTEVLDPLTGALTCPLNDYHMGVTAENIAEQYGISREQQDALAASSHQRAQHACENGYFNSQILPIEIRSRKRTQLIDTDEHIRFNCTSQSMSTLKPAFKKDGTVTAGNASGINDGAAALVLADKTFAEENQLKPLARIVAYSIVGVDPAIMGIGPIPAVNALLSKTGIKKNDIDIWEINEAFAAQAYAVINELQLDPAKVNPNGSGISLGHPIGASGAIISIKAIHEMIRTNARYAVATMCIGGGQGIAILFEACSDKL